MKDRHTCISFLIGLFTSIVSIYYYLYIYFYRIEGENPLPYLVSRYQQKLYIFVINFGAIIQIYIYCIIVEIILKIGLSYRWIDWKTSPHYKLKSMRHCRYKIQQWCLDLILKYAKLA